MDDDDNYYYSTLPHVEVSSGNCINEPTVKQAKSHK